MTKKSQFPPKQPSTDDIIKDSQTTPASEADHVAFEQRYNELMSEFASVCSKEGVTIAYAILVDPKSPRPLVFRQGDQIRVTLLLNEAVGVERARCARQLGAMLTQLLG